MIIGPENEQRGSAERNRTIDDGVIQHTLINTGGHIKSESRRGCTTMCSEEDGVQRINHHHAYGGQIDQAEESVAFPHEI